MAYKLSHIHMHDSKFISFSKGSFPNEPKAMGDTERPPTSCVKSKNDPAKSPRKARVSNILPKINKQILEKAAAQRKVQGVLGQSMCCMT